MAAEVDSRKEVFLRAFRHWVSGVRVLSSDLIGSDDWVFVQYLESWQWSCYDPQTVCGWYRSSGLGDEIFSEVVRAVLHRCLGHRLDRRLVLGFPRVAALCSGMFFRDRWLEGEDSIGRDPVACYLYGKSLGGRLPSHLLNRLVLEHGSSYGARRWFLDFG
jgi:hypothetical protein